jgi:hypothetical protein
LRRTAGIEAKPRPSSSWRGLSAASAASDFVDYVIAGDYHNARTLRRARTSVSEIVAEFSKREAFCIADYDRSDRLVGGCTGFREQQALDTRVV